MRVVAIRSKSVVKTHAFGPVGSKKLHFAWELRTCLLENPVKHVLFGGFGGRFGPGAHFGAVLAHFYVFLRIFASAPDPICGLGPEMRSNGAQRAPILWVFMHRGAQSAPIFWEFMHQGA